MLNASRCFQPGEGLLRNCKIFANLRSGGTQRWRRNFWIITSWPPQQQQRGQAPGPCQGRERCLTLAWLGWWLVVGLSSEQTLTKCSRQRSSVIISELQFPVTNHDDGLEECCRSRGVISSSSYSGYWFPEFRGNVKM